MITKNKRIALTIFALMLLSLACMGPLWALNPNSPEYQGTVQAQRQMDAQLSMQQTLAAAQANQMNAQATAVINDSSDSPQGGVNIYKEGHRDGYKEGVDDTTANNTIRRQQNSLEWWQLIALAFACMFLGGVFLNWVRT